MELTKQHLTLLRTAADRDGGLLPRPDRLVGTARRRMADRLLAAGVVETVSIANDQPCWFGGSDEGSTGLRITEAGRALLSGDAGQEPRAAMQEGVAAGAVAERGNGAINREAGEVGSSGTATKATAHRSGTKRALMIELLERDGGATLAALADALGWQPHTARRRTPSQGAGAPFRSG